MQQHLFDLTALGLAAAGVIALLSAWAKTTWWLALEAPLGIAIALAAIADFGWMLPSLRHIESDMSLNNTVVGIEMAVIVVAAGLGALFVVQLLARVRARETDQVLAQLGSSYQLLGGVAAIAASAAYLLLRMHLLDWAT